MIKSSLSCIVLLCLSLAQAATFSCPKSAKTLLIVGDSLSAAYGINKELGWVNLLDKKLTRLQLKVQVFNVSISGQTALQAEDRINAWLQRFKPDFVILELGANDGLRGVTEKQLATRLGILVRAIEQTGAKTLLLGVRLPPNYGSFYLRGISNAYQQVARDFSVLFEPKMLLGVSENRELMQTDRLHPKASAQPKILAHLWPSIAKLLGCVATP